MLRVIELLTCSWKNVTPSLQHVRMSLGNYASTPVASNNVIHPETPLQEGWKEGHHRVPLLDPFPTCHPEKHPGLNR
jgi:hypothetical protein